MYIYICIYIYINSMISIGVASLGYPSLLHIVYSASFAITIILVRITVQCYSTAITQFNIVMSSSSSGKCLQVTENILSKKDIGQCIGIYFNLSL